MAAVQPSGLMDIASSLSQDDIPFKLRCAICNKLAVNAFRLPCCDQAICENCQTSLPDTCPVCAHTPVSSDLCKPNKALRTTLKAFLRTEEKKREKDRQAALSAPIDDAPLEETTAPEYAHPALNTIEGTPADGVVEPTPTDVSETQPVDEPTPAVAASGVPVVEQGETNEIAETEPPENNGLDTANQTYDAEQAETVEGDTNVDGSVQPSDQDAAQNAVPGAGFPNAMGFNMNPAMFPNMAWGANPMAQFMGNGMMGFPNPMGMAGMGMDPSQGMFGGYGMNMSGMNGMNMGMNFNAGQGMYNGWDGSQNNMWNGSQDKFNPNAFTNGMGAQFGDASGFGGYNMSQPNGVNYQMQQQQFPNQEYQNGYHSPGNYRGRGRGYNSGGRGRGGYGGHMHSNYSHNANQMAQNNGTPSQNEAGAIEGTESILSEGKNDSTEDPDATNGLVTKDSDDKVNGDSSVTGTDIPSDQITENRLQGIPTIDSLDQTNGVSAHMTQGYGRGGGYMRGGYHSRGGSFGGQQFNPGNNTQPRGQGVEGAPAAPRAMRQGLPNTSVFRQRNLQGSGRASIPKGTEASETPAPEPAKEDHPAQSTSRSISGAKSRSRSRSRAHSPSNSRSDSRSRHRQRSRSVDNNTADYDRASDRHRGSHVDNEIEPRTRSPSDESHRSRHRDKGRRRDRRSHRSHRHRSRSRSTSPTRKDGPLIDDRLASIAEERVRSTSRTRHGESRDRSSHAHRSGKDRSNRHEDDRERDRDSRRRDRDRDRDRDRQRENERERDRERDRPRERDRDRERDRKRSRRDRSESGIDSDYHARKTKRGREDETRTSTSARDRTRETREKSQPSKPSEPEKDPHTFEREARNKERLLKEQQRREAMHADRDSGKSSRRRDSRQERGGRRLNYQYDDETDSNASLFDGESSIPEFVDIVFLAGVIQSVVPSGSLNESSIPQGARVLNVSGKHVTPGLVDMHSHHLLIPFPALAATSYVNERPLLGSTTPFVRAIDGFTPADPSTKYIASGGITSSLIPPGSANIIGGEAYPVKNLPFSGPNGEPVIEELRLQHEIPEGDRQRYLKMACGENPKNVYHYTRLGLAYLLREQLQEANNLREKQNSWCRAAYGVEGSRHIESFIEREGSRPSTPLKYDTLISLLQGELNVNVHCYTPEDFERMLAVLHEFNIHPKAFHHALEAWQVPELWKQLEPNITIATFADNALFKAEAYGGNLRASKILNDHGIPVALKSDHTGESNNAKYLLDQASIAYTYGLPADKALQPVTSIPAISIQQGHRIGYVRAGYDADLVIWDDHPLQVGATPVEVFIDGRPLLENEGLVSQLEVAPIEIKKVLLEHPSIQDEETSELSLLLQNNKIACLGRKSTCLTQHTNSKPDISVTEITLQNGHITPGLIAFGNSLGIQAISPESSTGDGTSTSPSHPSTEDIHFAKYGIHLHGRAFDRARLAGITRAVTAPQARGFVQGVSVVALHFTVGQAAKSDSTPTVGSGIEALRRILEQGKKENEQGIESLFARAANGSLPPVVHAVNEPPLPHLSPTTNLIISGGHSAALLAAHLAAASIPVILSPPRNAPDSWETQSAPPTPRLANTRQRHCLMQGCWWG
ncbi:hypothetical protein BJX70DRAFT_401562 [Aspergillus crustosus]